MTSIENKRQILWFECERTTNTCVFFFEFLFFILFSSCFWTSKKRKLFSKQIMHKSSSFSDPKIVYGLKTKINVCLFFSLGCFDDHKMHLLRMTSVKTWTEWSKNHTQRITHKQSHQFIFFVHFFFIQFLRKFFPHFSSAFFGR